MKVRRTLSFFLLAAWSLELAAFAQAVPLDREPSHHLALQNEYVRAFKVEVAPHASTLLHQHDHDYVFVTLGPSSVENDVLGKAPVKLELQDGEARFAKGGFAHVAKNLSDKPFRNVTVELLKGGEDVVACDHTKAQCGSYVGRDYTIVGTGEDRKGLAGDKLIVARSYQVLVGKNLEIRRTEIPPGLSGAQHTHGGPHLAIALTDLDLRSMDSNGNSREVHQRAGEIAWVPGGVGHTLTNIGAKPAGIVTIEFTQ